MALVPETLWDEWISFTDFEGGRRYYSEYINSASCDEFMQPGKILKVDCSGLDENTHISRATGLYKILYEFPNGVQVGIVLYKQAAHDGLPAHVKGESFMRLGSTYRWYSTNINGWVSSGAYASFAAVKTYGLTVFLETYYLIDAANMGGVYEGLTKADSIHFHVLLPYVGGSALQSWDHISTEGRAYILNSINDPTANIDTAAGFYYGCNTVGEGISFTYDLFVYTSLTTLMEHINAFTPTTPLNPDDVYTKQSNDPEKDTTKPGGGGGDYTPVPGDGSGGYDPKSEPVDIPTPPTGGAISTGSIKAFLVTEQKVESMFRRLWNNNIFDVLTWQKLIQEPMDAIVSLTCIPCVPTYESNGSHIQLGNIDTEVVAPIITDEYVQIDMGSLTVKPYWGSALDYSPYTKIDIYVPGVGIRPIKPEDVINQPMRLVYIFDVLTGNFSANLKCGMSVLYKFQGNLKASVPITSRIFSALESVMKGAGQAAAQYATGAMTAGDKKDATPESIENAAVHQAGAAAISAAVNVAMSKVSLQRSGDLSGSTGLLDDFVPYVIIHRPVQSLAKDFKSFKGYPSNITAVLNTLSGYTEVEYIQLHDIGATDQELTEIEAQLKAGVII